MAETGQVWGGWAPEIRDDPFPHFAAARSRCPVQKVRLADGHDAWVILGHDAARQALNDPRISKDMLAAVDGDADVVAEGLPGPAFSRHMLNVDPPDHTRLRRLVARAFVPSRVAALEPAVRAAAGALVDEMAARGTDTAVDLVEGYAQPLPFQVIGDLLGIPRGDRPELHGCFQVLLSAWTGDPPAHVVAASDRIVAYLGELVDTKRREPADDLVSVLVTAGDDDRLTRQELLSSLFQLIVAGHDTTTSLIGNGTVALLDHPEQLRLLTDDLRRLPAAIDELMRFTAPVPHATFRMTSEPVTVDGVDIPAREQVLVSLAAANRDPRRYPDPDVLDIARDDGPNLGFGHGIHHCLGAPLARLEARIAFETLLGRHPRLRLACDRAELAWTHGDGLVLRGLAALPVVLGPDGRDR
jgi:cytochrome P450